MPNDMCISGTKFAYRKATHTAGAQYYVSVYFCHITMYHSSAPRTLENITLSTSTDIS